jgi:hypothetical protein
VACAGEDSGEALRLRQSFLATRGAALEQELASGGVATAASGSAAAAAEKTEEGERGHPRVLYAITGITGTSLQNKTSLCSKAQMRKWSK